MISPVETKWISEVGVGAVHSRPIRVLHVSNIESDCPYLNNLCDFTDRSEVVPLSVTLAPHGGLVKGLEARGVRAYALDAMSRAKYPYAARQIWKIIERERVDIVHAHLFDPTLIGLIVSKLRRVKVIVTRHHSDAHHQIPGSIKRRAYLGIEKCVNACADHIIAPSRMVREILISQEGVRPDKVSLIPYGQTPDRFNAVTPETIQKVRSELGMDRQLALVCNSRIYHRKGHPYLFRALAPLIRSGLKAKLYLVGTGHHEYRAELERLADELGISQYVRFLGWRNDALHIMAAADIIVHPSLEDALSQALIEGVMLGKPIVATDISGARDSLDDGRFGVIVPPADADAFRAGMEKVIADLFKGRGCAKGGSRYILEYMGAARVAREYVACYHKVCGLEAKR